MPNNVAFYGSHNGALVFQHHDKFIVVEAERFAHNKNLGFVQYRLCKHPRFVMEEILRFVENEYDIKNDFDTCIYTNTDVIYGQEKFFFEKYLNAKKHLCCLHHRAHASGTFYQSPFKEALIFSFDGGGSDGFFNVYTATRPGGVVEIKRHNLDLGFAYMIFGHYIDDISFERDLNIGNLVYSGKLMGLCGYGSVKPEWLLQFEHFYRSKPDGLNYKDLIKTLGDQIGIIFDTDNRVKDQLGRDIAATSQQAFENVFFHAVQPYIDLHPDLPICVTGGCALNVVLNTKLKHKVRTDVFVAPNSNDCGIAFGMMMDLLKPADAVDITYAGIPILDKYCLSELIESRWSVPADISTVADKLQAGNIIGVIRGNSEHGPRALGNRSILCNPSIPNMKDTLNSKVKHREWFRPFAPVVRLEDVSEYFEFEGESRFMSFYAPVRPEWREKLSSITHVDGTARLQTITREQNEWMYDLLTDFKAKTGVGVLLNTSFNVNGKPLLTTYKDALNMLDTTGLDYILTEQFLISKR